MNFSHTFFSCLQKKINFLLLVYGMGAPFVFSQTIMTVAGNGTPGFSGDGGPALSAMLSDIDGMATDDAGNLYIVDSANQRVRRVDAATQIITTVAGNGIFGFAGDGGLATSAQFNDIDSVSLDTQGNLYIADTGNSRIREVDRITGIVKTIAGNGVAAYSGDGGPALLASLRFPGGVTLDAQNNIYIADTYNSRIRRVDGVTGIISTVAGKDTYGFSGDGGLATMAELRFPSGVAVDAQQNIFIADTFNNRIRRVDSITQLISTVAGNVPQGFGGDGGPAPSASLGIPAAVIVDAAGSLFIADSNNQRVRKVEGSTGVISTVAGTGAAFYSGDGGAAILAELNGPSSVGKDGKGNLYIADDNNNRVRKVAAIVVIATPTPAVPYTPTVTPLPTPTFTPAATSTPICETHVWPNPFNPATAVGGVLKMSCLVPGGTVSFFTLAGEEVRKIQEVNGLALWDGRNQLGILVSTGIYFYVIQNGEKVIQSGKLLVKLSPGVLAK